VQKLNQKNEGADTIIL